MNRREFIALLASVAAAVPIAAGAQSVGRVYRIGLIVSGGPDFWEPDFNIPNVRAFQFGLRDLGYVDKDCIREMPSCPRGDDQQQSWGSAEGSS